VTRYTSHPFADTDVGDVERGDPSTSGDAIQKYSSITGR
jgi:hypothetical protein